MSKIKDFNPNELTLPFTMIILGRSHSGKSQQLHTIMYNIYKNFKKEISEVYLFSQTGLINQEEFFYIQTDNIFENINVGFIKMVLENQKLKKLNHEEPKQIIFLFDDIIGDTNVKSPVIINLFTLGRHYNITTILLSQTYVQTGGLSAVIRRNSNWILSFYIQNEDRRKQFIKEYASIKNSNDGENVFREITSVKYQSMVVDTRNTTARDYEGYIYKFKINIKKKIPKFLFGSKYKIKKAKVIGSVKLLNLF